MKTIKFEYGRKECWNELTKNVRVRLDGKYVIDADTYHGVKAMLFGTKEHLCDVKEVLPTPCYTCESAPCECGEKIEKLDCKAPWAMAKKIDEIIDYLSSNAKTK